MAGGLLCPFVVQRVKGKLSSISHLKTAVWPDKGLSEVNQGSALFRWVTVSHPPLTGTGQPSWKKYLLPLKAENQQWVAGSINKD